MYNFAYQWAMDFAMGWDWIAISACLLPLILLVLIALVVGSYHSNKYYGPH